MSEKDKPTIKAKLPDARTISRTKTDFKPQGINRPKAKVGVTKAPPQISGMTAAGAKRRRIIFGVVTVVAVLVVAAGVTYIVTRPAPSIKVTGAFGKEPVVKKAPGDMKQPAKTVTTVLTKGTGAKVVKGDYAFINAATYDWLKKPYKWKSVGSDTIKTNKPSPVQVGSGQSLTGLEKALTGQTVGSRLLVQIPPAEALGSTGNSQLGIGASDTLVFVIDITSTLNKDSASTGTPQAATDKTLPTITDNGAGKAPTVNIPKGTPPADLKTEVLLQGSGAKVAKGQTLFMQYDGVLWRDGKSFDSSFKNGSLFTTPIGEGQVITGWDKALVGQTVGSRVLMVIPPKDGYGTKGNGTIKGDDTMVFVVDILAAIG